VNVTDEVFGSSVDRQVALAGATAPTPNLAHSPCMEGQPRAMIPRMARTAEDPPSRKLVSPGEWLTLLGMVLCVVSPRLPWAISVPQAIVPSAFAAVYVRRLARPVTAFELDLGRLSVGWVVIIAAVTCACLLLWEPHHRQRPFFATIQIVLALTIASLAALHIGPFLGVFVAILGALLLLGGAVARYH
jgi:hypothetical protein